MFLLSQDHMKGQCDEARKWKERKQQEGRKDKENVEEKEVKPKKRINLFSNDSGNTGDANLTYSFIVETDHGSAKGEVTDVANEISSLDNGLGNDISAPAEELHTSSLDNCLNKDVKICEGSTKPVLPGPGSQRGLGEGGPLVGTAIPPGPSPLRGPGSSAHAIRTESEN